jgi:hypothetical protein
MAPRLSPAPPGLSRYAGIGQATPAFLVEIISTSDARHRTPLRGTPFWHDGMRAGSAIIAILRDNGFMRQLQLFTTAELGRMRDRTASRNHSPERDEFRRLHAHHRAWGLVQRHGRRLHRLRTSSCAPRPARTPDNGRQDGDQAPAPAVLPASAVAPDLTPASAVVPAPAPAEQRQRSTPAAFEQRRSPARNQPTRNQATRDQHVAARQQPAPPPPHADPRCHLPSPATHRLPRPGHGTVRSAGEAATRTSNPGRDKGADAGPVAPDPDRPTPETAPPTASRGSDRQAEAARPMPRPPRHRHREARKMVAGVTIHARPNPITFHPFLAPDRPAKARGP